MVSADNARKIISQYLMDDVLPVIPDLERSSGNRMHDAVSGRSYLDCVSYIASNPLGHNHPGLSTPDFESRLLRVAKTKPSSSDFFTIELARFVETFSRIALPLSFKHLFFIEGGTLGVENAFKAAFDWKVQINIARGRGANLGTKVIHFRDAFHGRSGYTLSLTNTADDRKTRYFPKFNWPRFENPKVAFPLTAENEADAAAREALVISELRDTLAREGDDIAAIILEPIQGEGGDHHFRPQFHQALRAVADDFEVLLIYDEVQSGLGLTGRMWAYEHFGIVPDMVAFGKKVQVCGFMASERIDSVGENVFKVASRINSTWGGNLTDMVRSERFLEIIKEEGLVENAAVVGARLLSGLEELVKNLPEVFSNARGRGLMCAIDLDSAQTRDLCLKEAFERGLLCLKCGVKSLRFRPSLTLNAAEADEVVSILTEAGQAVQSMTNTAT